MSVIFLEVRTNRNVLIESNSCHLKFLKVMKNCHLRKSCGNFFGQRKFTTCQPEVEWDFRDKLEDQTKFS